MDETDKIDTSLLCLILEKIEYRKKLDREIEILNKAYKQLAEETSRLQNDTD